MIQCSFCVEVSFVLGSVPAAILLGHFKRMVMLSPGGGCVWMKTSGPEITRSTGLTYSQQKTARSKLEEADLVGFDVRRGQGMTRVRLDLDVLEKFEKEACRLFWNSDL